METRTDEIADGIYRISTFIPEVAAPAGFQVLRSLAELQPTTLAVMHGSSFHGDGGAALRAFAEAYEQRFSPESEFVELPSVLEGPSA